MTDQQTEQMTDAAAELDAIAEAAAREEKAEQAKAQAETAVEEGEWEDASAQEEQARALAKMAVQGVEIAAGIIHKGHSLDRNQRATGEEALLPVTRDFSGEVPEWLRPYMHYLGAGLWLGGVFIGAYRARQADEAEKKAKESDKESGNGGQS